MGVLTHPPVREAVARAGDTQALSTATTRLPGVRGIVVWVVAGPEGQGHRGSPAPGRRRQHGDPVRGAAGLARSRRAASLRGGTRGSDSNGAKSHVKGRSWDCLASHDLSPSVSQGTIWRYVAVDRRLGYAQLQA